jgi:hypothetical protein
MRPRKKKLRKMSDDKAEGTRNKVKRLLSAGVIREVTYIEWLANTVMVKKANRKWRIVIHKYWEEYIAQELGKHKRFI